jgi:hypothetical protein
MHYFQGEISFVKDHPLLIAYAVITNTLNSDASLKQIELRKKDFDRYPGLYNFVRTFILYQNKNYAQIIAEEPKQLPIDQPSFIATEV